MNPELVALLQTCSRDLNDSTSLLVAADWCQDHAPDFDSTEFLLRWLTQCPNLPRLFTGSRCYGMVTDNSDFDWVLKLPEGTIGKLLSKELRDGADTAGRDYGELFGSKGLDHAYRFGYVNLLIVSSVKQWNAWEVGTYLCVFRKPVSRADAVKTFETQRQIWGVA